MSAAREAFVQNDANKIRDALAYLFGQSEIHARQLGLPDLTIGYAVQLNDALAALDRLEELAT